MTQSGETTPFSTTVEWQQSPNAREREVETVERGQRNTQRHV
jgi:hypothetical protein